MIDKNENIKNKLALLPDTPGVYQYFDKTGKIIYVGKAKNLKRRVSSYFNKVHDSPKTNILVKNIYDLQYIVVKTEEDALHLENSLIKAYKPRYNVLLKDDKTYPWICLRNEHFPRVFLTRKVYKDGSKYYGPYANVHLAKTVLGLIRELYPIRTCNYALTPENIEKNRFRVCLQYHIKNCKGCCVGKISEQEYNGYIEQVRQILNGDIHQLSNHLLEEMSALSTELRFEEAQVVKEKYDLIEKYKAKSVIVNPALHEIICTCEAARSYKVLLSSIRKSSMNRLLKFCHWVLPNYVPDSEVGLRRLLYRFYRSLILLTLNLSFRKGGIRKSYSRYRNRM